MSNFKCCLFVIYWREREKIIYLILILLKPFLASEEIYGIKGGELILDVSIPPS